MVAGPEIGKAFARERIQVLGSRRQMQNSVLQFGPPALVEFLQSLLLDLPAPTLVLVNALNWRNHNVWPQLRNGDLAGKQDVLDFSNSRNQAGMIVARTDPRVGNLLGIIRLRSGDELPYYVTSGRPWDRMLLDRQGRELQDLLRLTGFIDPGATVPHYFSLGGLSLTSREQNRGDLAFSTMSTGEAGRISVKHARLVEMVPFFLREDFHDNWLVLCRVAHILRVSPAWEHANIIDPLVMHLASKLVEDRFCILGES